MDPICFSKLLTGGKEVATLKISDKLKIMAQIIAASILAMIIASVVEAVWPDDGKKIKRETPLTQKETSP